MASKTPLQGKERGMEARIISQVVLIDGSAGRMDVNIICILLEIITITI
jgi:hypothetical protein